jgi:hypothetical protein
MYFYKKKHLNLNPHISIDCVIFGFDGKNLKILLLKRKISGSEEDYKLPGDFITDDEDLDSAASRILKALTGLENIYLRQFSVFGSPDRISDPRDIEWLRKTTGLPVSRVVTIAYYSLIKLLDSKKEHAVKNGAIWKSVDNVTDIAFDHLQILNEGLTQLRMKLQFKPVGMELLPTKFTLRQLQNLYEMILDKKLDNRNFRKKVLKANYLIPLDEKEKKVAHKPARLYSFNKKIYKNSFNQFEGFQF